MSYIVKLSNETLSYIERYYYDYMAKKSNVEFILNNYDNIENIQESELFKYYKEKEQQAFKNYNKARHEFYNHAVPEVFKSHKIRWSINFLRRELIIDMLCNCEVNYED